jgi:hypothetical protein
MALAMLALLALLALPGAAAAQDLYTWTVAAMGGLGGSTDVQTGSRSFDHGGWQLEGSVVTDPSVALVLRVGDLGLGSRSTQFGDVLGADLAYLTLAGQYRFQESYYDSGIYLGIGGYRLGGNNLAGSSASTTAIGGVLGFTGEFKATRRFGVLVELSGHYVDLKDVHLFAMAHAGLAFHF